VRAASSYRLAVRARDLGEGAVDADEHLPALVLAADPEALADLRARALAPLDGLRPASRDKHPETLRSRLLHQGRREAGGAEQFLHPQTVRYRMGQLRELYGERLDDPQQVLHLVLALGAVP
jgi:DNA-binding PucR family transcriptional regulator